MPEKVQILVVDDELIVRESLVGWMKRAGHNVMELPGAIRHWK